MCQAGTAATDYNNKWLAVAATSMATLWAPRVLRMALNSDCTIKLNEQSVKVIGVIVVLFSGTYVDVFLIIIYLCILNINL